MCAVVYCNQIVNVFPPSMQEMAGYHCRGGVVLGSCDIPFQCRAFCFVLHIAFAVPASHKGGNLNLHVLIFMVLFFHHKLTKSPFRELVYQVAGNKQNVFCLWCHIYEVC